MSVSLHYPDGIGLLGAVVILAGFFLNQHGSLASSDWRFPALNLLGSLLILFSLCFAFNLPSVVIEIAWLAISIYGLVRSLFLRKAGSFRN